MDRKVIDQAAAQAGIAADYINALRSTAGDR